ncbi:MAG TPA: acetaldehyde dehydrogenase, partial [Bacteroidota bacterium]|nr:acetaldehyde dehydrogenase [Bacteroidota bacterium]
DSPVKTRVVEEFRKRKAYFVSQEEKERLGRTMFDPKGAINPDIVGKPPAYIAQKAGFNVPPDTSCIVAELQGVGREYPLSREKLSPVLAMFTVDGWREGCERSIEMLEFGGLGHTMVIHSSDKEIIMKFALEKPACRILANTQAALGAVGYTNELLPSMTLGPGTFGKSIISENVSAKHLINIKRLAFETRPINEGREYRIQETGDRSKKIEELKKEDGGRSWLDEIDERIRLKAGNQPVRPKVEPAPKETTEPESGPKYGTGMTLEEVERVVREFRRQN